MRGGVVIHEQRYPHAPERVWRALVDSDELARWLMAGPFVTAVGHTFTAWWAPLGPIEATVVDVERPRRLTWLWKGAFGHAVVRFALSPDNGGTRLRLEHRGLDHARSGSPPPLVDPERTSVRSQPATSLGTPMHPPRKEHP